MTTAEAPEVTSETQTSLESPNPEGATDASVGNQGAASSDPAAAAATADASAETGDSGEPPSFEALLGEIRGEKVAAESEPQLPGKTLEERLADTWQAQYSQTYNKVFQDADRDAVQTAMRNAGVDSERARYVWENVLRPALQQLHALNEGHNLVALDSVVGEVLGEEAAKEYGKRDYREYKDGSLLPLTSRRNALKAALTLAVNAEITKQRKEGKLLTRDEGEKLYKAAFSAGRGQGERNGRSAKSGNPQQGTANTGASGSLTVEDASTLPIAELVRRGF